MVCGLYNSRMSAAADQAVFLAKVGSPSEIFGLFDWLPDVHLYVKDREGVFMWVNPASARRNGCESPSDIVGKTDFDFHPPQMAEAYREEDRRVIHGGKAIPEQVWLVYDYLGAQKWFVSTKVPLRGEDGEIIGLAGVMRPLQQAGHLKDDYEGLASVVETVMERYGERLGADELAGLVGLSVSQLNRRFKKFFGISPMQYVQRVRVNAARTMLARTAEPVGQIALTCGFYDQSQMARIFKRETGITCGEYRDRYRKMGN